jgi:tRNA pseudouridine13 synthase
MPPIAPELPVPPDPDVVIAWEALPSAHGAPRVTGRVRAAPEDFVVEEVLGFDPAGHGQHVLVQVRKRGVDTPRVATALAALAGVPAVGVGYSGLKDRRAVTTQWLSVDLAGRPEPDWAALGVEGVEVLAAHRHDRKLRRGAHRANRFVLTVRELAGDRAGLEARLARVAEAGVPNYFGEQRFGRGGANPAKAFALLRGEGRVRDRTERGLLLSAARAVLFNRVLAARVVAGSWDRALPGEVLMLDGRHSWFVADEVGDELRDRVARGEVHPTGPLWGRGEPGSQSEARAVEAAALECCEAWCEGLERAGLEQDRRALRVVPRDLAWEPLTGGVLRLSLTLPAGAYATTVLRELVG